MQLVEARFTGVVIPLPDIAQRPPRPAIAEHEPRGEIVLFMGVRYERLADRPSEVSPVEAPQPRVRRRRRRS
jgi:hypothetical protein